MQILAWTQHITSARSDAGHMEPQIHPLHVRIGHWISALTVFALVWTGFAMFANNRHYAPIVHALPAWLWSGLQMTGHGTVGRAWHLGFAIVMIANALWYGIAALRSTSWRRIVPSGRTWFGDALRATLAELRHPRETMQPSAYNAAQKIAYTGVLVLGMLLIVSGVALWFKSHIPWLLAGLGGARVVLPAHIIIATLVLTFIIIHLTQVVRAGVPTLLSMIAGTTDMRPQRTRRALAFSGAVLATLLAGFTAIRLTSGPSGVPIYLRWAVERSDQRTRRPQDIQAGGTVRERVRTHHVL